MMQSDTLLLILPFISTRAHTLKLLELCLIECRIVVKVFYKLFKATFIAHIILFSFAIFLPAISKAVP